MKKVFISHSTKDKKLVENFIEMLQLGMGIHKEQIFCTSIKGNLQTGRDYIQRIKTELGNDWAIMAIISENYLNSVSCTMELGAAWILGEKANFFPILVQPVSYRKMDTTLLKGTQMLCMDKQEDMLNLYDECCKSGLIKQQDTAGFYKTLQKFHCEIKKYSDFEETICRPDKDGYYKTEITAVREVPDGYRCYRFKGLLEQQDAYKEDETHWLFYKKGEFRELSVGDFVRFKVKTTKLRQFWDLKNARNIYPLVLERVE